MSRSFDGRAEKEIAFRQSNRNAISTVAKFAGMDHLKVASEMSKRIDGGRKQVFVNGEFAGYK